MLKVLVLFDKRSVSQHGMRLEDEAFLRTRTRFAFFSCCFVIAVWMKIHNSSMEKLGQVWEHMLVERISNIVRRELRKIFCLPTSSSIPGILKWQWLAWENCITRTRNWRLDEVWPWKSGIGMILKLSGKVNVNEVNRRFKCILNYKWALISTYKYRIFLYVTCTHTHAVRLYLKIFIFVLFFSSYNLSVFHTEPRRNNYIIKKVYDRKKLHAVDRPQSFSFIHRRQLTKTFTTCVRSCGFQVPELSVQMGLSNSRVPSMLFFHMK